MGRYTTLLELKRTSPPLEGELSVRPQRYTTNPIKVEGVASRHRSPYTFPQAPGEEHRLTQRSNNRLHSKIAPSRGLTKSLSQGGKKRTSTGHRSEQYWSRLRPVLVTTTDQYWSHRRQYWLIFSSRIEYREYSSSRCSYSPLSYGEFQLCMMRQP